MPEDPSADSYIELREGKRSTWPGFWAWTPIVYHVKDTEYDLELTIDKRGLLLELVALQVRSRATGQAVDGAGIRRLRLTELAAAGAWNGLHRRIGKTYELDPMSAVLADLRARIVRTSSGRVELPDADGLRLVGLIHRAALITGMRPQVVLMDNLEISRSTANYWIAQARKDRT